MAGHCIPVLDVGAVLGLPELCCRAGMMVLAGFVVDMGGMQQADRERALEGIAYWILAGYAVDWESVFRRDGEMEFA